MRTTTRATTRACLIAALALAPTALAQDGGANPQPGSPLDRQGRIGQLTQEGAGISTDAPKVQPDLGGCVQHASGKMSLLGVEYAGGPDVPRGAIRNLGVGHPAMVELASKETKIRELDAAQKLAVENEPALSGYKNPGWVPIQSWEQAVSSVKGGISALQAQIDNLKPLIKNSEAQVKGSRQQLAEARDADTRASAQTSLEFFEKELAQRQGDLTQAQQELSALEQRLPALEHGLANHAKLMVPARAAKDRAEQHARQEAAKCP